MAGRDRDQPVNLRDVSGDIVRLRSIMTQLILPADLCTAVYADTTTHAGAQARLGAITLASDPVSGTIRASRMPVAP